MTIRDIIIKYSKQLESLSDTPRLDVEILLQKALGDVDRIYIHMNINKELTEEQDELFKKLIKDRLNILLRNCQCSNNWIKNDKQYNR